MIINLKQNDIVYSKISTPSPAEKNVFKFKEQESSSILTIEEIKFPKKYLNKVKSNSTFNFEFSKEKIITFIKDEI